MFLPFQKKWSRLEPSIRFDFFRLNYRCFDELHENAKKTRIYYLLEFSKATLENCNNCRSVISLHFALRAKCHIFSHPFLYSIKFRFFKRSNDASLTDFDQ